MRFTFTFDCEIEPKDIAELIANQQTMKDKMTKNAFEQFTESFNDWLANFREMNPKSRKDSKE